MTRTADGHVLRLSLPRARAMSARLETLGLAEAVRSNYRGNLVRAIARTLIHLGQGARRAGSIVGRRTGRRYVVFRSEDDGEAFRIVGAPRPDGSFEVVELRSLGATGEREDGDGTRQAHWELVRHLMGLPPDAPYSAVRAAWNESKKFTRSSERQVRNADTRENPKNVTDRAYWTTDGTLVNVELDTKPGSANDHFEKLQNFDKKAWHYSLLTDQKTGQVLAARRWNPETRRVETIPVKDGRIESVGLPALRKTELPSERRRTKDPQEALKKRIEAGKDPFGTRKTRAAARSAAKPRARPSARPARARPARRGGNGRSREMEAELEAAAEALEVELAEALGGEAPAAKLN